MKDTVLIRPAKPGDAFAIIQNNQAMAQETESRFLDPEIIGPGVRAVLEDFAKGFYTVAELNGEVIGNLMITYEWSDWRNGDIWWIQSVYVQPQHRNKGVFRSLFDYIVEQAGMSKAKEIRLYAEKENVNAHQVYEKLGMHKSHYILFEMALPQNPK